MQIVRCNIGIWEVEARVEEVGRGKLMAAIRARGGQGGNAPESQHVVVFDHAHGSDQTEETKRVMQRVLKGAN